MTTDLNENNSNSTQDSDANESINTSTGEIKKGDIVDGTIINITNFGAFIKLANEKDGLVHISEVANQFVTNIEDHLVLGQTVTVKVLNINDNGKYELSIKRAKVKPKKEALFIHKKTENENFEDMINNFMKKSEEKHIDIRRNIKQKQGIKKHRK